MPVSNSSLNSPIELLFLAITGGTLTGPLTLNADPTTNLGAATKEYVDNKPGVPGPQGPKGDTGATGATGPQGIQGNPGPTGNTGSQGPTGLAGSVWYTGSGAPTSGTGVLNDWYLDHSSGNYYLKTSGTAWSLQGNLTGPQGLQGTQGIQGVAGPTGQTGATGSQGPQGPIGNTGLTGPQGIQGDIGPAGPQGIQGNAGPQGIQGNTGNPGSVWYTGTIAPPSATGVINDWYLNKTTGDVYLKTAASTWTYQSNITGPQGLTGPQGSQGLQGPTGPQGPIGNTGPAGPTGQGVPTGGTLNQVLAKNSSTNYDTTWVSVMTQAQADLRYIQLSGGTLTGPLILNADPTVALGAVTKQYVDALQSQITALSATVTNLNSQVQALTTRLNADELTLSDHESRITVLENEANNSTAPVDPFVGAVVHVVDTNGNCQPAIVYEDWKAQNSRDIVSVVVVAPERLNISDWDSKIEVQKEAIKTNGETPFNYWHWPERYYGTRQLQIFVPK